MIIKSMARKTPSFGQLIHYLDKNQEQGDQGLFSRNLFASKADRQAVKREFEENFSYLKKRAKSNALYHEIIVLDQGITVPRKLTDKVLIDLAERYCQLRAPNQLVYGRIHDDHDHRHIHLMISANPIKSPQRVRLSKQLFSDIQQEIEKYLLEQYPELKVTPIYTQSRFAQRMKVKNREGEMERRTNKPSKKRFLRETFIRHLGEAQSMDDLKKRLTLNGIQIYQRGQQVGLEPVGEGRRFRLKTLGVNDSYQQALLRFQREVSRKKALRESRGHSQKTQNLDRSNDSPQKTANPRENALLRDRQASESFAKDHLQDSDQERDSSC